MDFLQRHLPRVYQAVQSAMVYLTNVTAQIFGAPPNAPQPRNAQAHKTPLQSSTPQETSGTQVTDQTPSAPDIISDDSIVGVTEQNGERPRTPPGDTENQETDVQHQKGHSCGRLDLQYKISDDKDMLSDIYATMEQHTNLENTAHSYKKEMIGDLKQMESEDTKTSSQSVTSPTHHAVEDQLINLDLKKENQDSLTGQEHILFQHGEDHCIPESLMLHDQDKLLSDLEHKDREPTVGPYSNSTEEIENICPQPSTLNVLTCEVGKAQSDVADEEKSDNQEETICHINVTSHNQEFIGSDGQISNLSVDITAPPVTVDNDNVLDATDINYPEQRKRLVTPASETDNSPYEASKTWEDLQETAIRLALQCNLVEKDSQECEQLGYVTEATESVHVRELHSIITDDQGYTRENLVDMSSLKGLWEVKGPGIEEGPMTVQSLMSEQSRSSGELCAEEGQLDLLMEEEEKTSVEEQAQEQSGFPIDGAQENIQHTEQESSPNFSSNKKSKRRVHFSPSTEELITKLDPPSVDTDLIDGDYRLEEALQQTDEYTGHQTISHLIIDSSQSLNKKREDDYLEDTDLTQDNGSLICGPMSAESENPLQTVSTVWYDEDEVKTEGGDVLCESLVDMVYQTEHVVCQVEDTLMSITDNNKSLESHLPSDEEMHENETEPAKKTDAPLRYFGEAELSMENEKICNLHTEISHSEADHSLELEKSYLSKSDHYDQEGSDSAEDNTATNTEFLEEINHSIGNTEIQLDYLPLEAITEPLIQKVHGNDTHVINEELLRTLHPLSQEDFGSFEENKDKDGSTTAQLRSRGSVDNIQREPNSAGESLIGMCSSEAENLLQSLQEDDESKNYNIQEIRSLGQQVSPDSNYHDEESQQRLYDSRKEQSIDETDTSTIKKAEDLASEEISEDLKEANVPAVTDSEMVTYTCEVEEQLDYLQEEDTDGKRNKFSCHEENLQPDTTILHKNGREIENGQLEERSVITMEATQEDEHQDYLEDGHETDLYHTDMDKEVNDSDGDLVQSAKVKEMDMVSVGESISAGDPQAAPTPDSESEEICRSEDVELNHTEQSVTLIMGELDVVSGLQNITNEDTSGESHHELLEIMEVKENLMATKLDASYITKVDLQNAPGAASGSDIETDEVSECEVPSDFLIEFQCTSISDHTVCEDPAMIKELDLPRENQSTVTLDMPLSGYSGDQYADTNHELDIASGSGFLGKGYSENIEEILGSASGTNSLAEKISESLVEFDLLSEIESLTTASHPAISVDEPNERVQDKIDILEGTDPCHKNDHFTEADGEDIVSELAMAGELVGTEENAQSICYLEELESSFKPYKEFEDKVKQHDSSSETVMIETQVEEANIGFVVISSSKENEIVITDHFRSEDIEQSEMKSFTEFDLLSEVQSVITTSHQVEVTTSVSTPKLSESDEGLGAEVDILKGDEHCHTMVHSSDGDGDNILSAVTMANDLMDTEENAQAMSQSEDPGSSLGPHQGVEDKIRQHDSSFPTVVTETHVKEANIDLGTINTSKDIGIVITTDYFESENKEESEIKSLPEVDDIRPETEEKAEQQEFSSFKPYEEFEDKVKQHDSSSETVMTETRVEETNIVFGVISSSKENEIFITDHFRSEDIEQSEIKSFSEFDLLSEIQSVITTSHQVEVTTSVSTPKLSESDEGLGAEVDILKGDEPCHTMVHSSDGDGDNILSAVTMADDLMDTEENAQAMSQSEEPGSSLGPHQGVEDKIRQHDSSSSTMVTETHVEEANIDLGTINTSKDIGIVITTDYFESEHKEESDSKSLPEADDIRPETEEKAEQQEFSNHKTITIQSDQTEQGRPGMREKHLQVVEPPYHIEISEDQERPLADQKEITDEPAMQEEDDVDGDMPPHSMLDVSAQRSRVQLRRKTSVRRKQGQRQVVSEIEPAAPPRPVVRPLSMAVPMFPPGTLPIFAPSPSKTPHATEEHVEEKPATDDLTVKPKKVIPKHAGFGMPSPQMMQELQARLKKKKPKE